MIDAKKGIAAKKREVGAGGSRLGGGYQRCKSAGYENGRKGGSLIEGW